MFVWRRGDKRSSRGCRVKVLSCSEGASGRNGFPWHFQSEKRAVKKMDEALGRAVFHVERRWRIDLLAKLDLILNDQVFCLLLSEHGLV